MLIIDTHTLCIADNGYVRATNSVCINICYINNYCIIANTHTHTARGTDRQRQTDRGSWATSVP